MSELSQDQFWMLQAIAEAEKAIYRTRPNPAVGCVIVKDGQIVGRGATAPVGLACRSRCYAGSRGAGTRCNCICDT